MECLRIDEATATADMLQLRRDSLAVSAMPPPNDGSISGPLEKPRGGRSRLIEPEPFDIGTAGTDESSTTGSQLELAVTTVGRENRARVFGAASAVTPSNTDTKMPPAWIKDNTGSGD